MRWGKWILLGVVAIIIVVAGGVFIPSEWMIRQSHDVAEEQLTADRSEAGVREGARLAHILSCLECHGPDGQGRQLMDLPLLAILRAPGLGRIVETESDARLARTIRHGVDRNGATLWVMPARTTLADDDTAHLVGFLRTLPATPHDVSQKVWLGPLARLQMLQGRLEPSVQIRIAAPAQRPADSGAYFVGLVCETCHDLYRARLAGRGEQAPPLAYMAEAYDEASFRRLLRTGRGIADRDLGAMRQVAQSALTSLSDDEIVAIKAYLARKAAESPPASH